MEKIYYSIGEVADITGVSPSTIRYWEKNFTELSPDKTSKGTRLFKTSDIEVLKLINHLIKERGMTVRGARQKLKDNRKEEENTWEIVKKLQEIKKMLTGIRDEMEE
ncbi:MAG: MerR family transcriptional regulator [Prolixibacteraceae bacterium]|nr:MerR family transcriptional regulator [Prolixibacteraceae bacterium]